MELSKRSSSLLLLPLERQNIPDGCNYPATPKYTISRPKFPPNAPNSERNHPPATSGIVVIYLLVPPTPAHTPALLHTPALSSGTLGISNTLPAHPKDAICHPNEPRLPGIHPGLLCFLGGGISPIYIDHIH
jgi:hypothetical protein